MHGVEHHPIELKPLMHRLAAGKHFVARATDDAYDVMIQDVHWDHPGGLEIHSGRQCLIELAGSALAGPEATTEYMIDAPDGRMLPVGALNFLPPQSSVQVRWNRGRRRALVCVLEPQRLGLLAGIDWRWNNLSPQHALDIQNPRLLHAMRWLASEIQAPSFGSGLQIQSLLTLLMIELQRHYQPAGLPPAERSDRLSTQQLTRLQNLIDASDSPDALSLAGLAQACDMPARTLSTLFKNTTGRTLRQHVADAHIQRAKLLLGDEALLIKQIAYRSGFRSAAAFGEAFRRATGLTPLQYRQQRGLRMAH